VRPQSACSGIPALLENIRSAWKYLTGTNIPFYFHSLAKKKSCITSVPEGLLRRGRLQQPGVTAIKLIYFSLMFALNRLGRWDLTIVCVPLEKWVGCGNVVQLNERLFFTDAEITCKREKHTSLFWRSIKGKDKKLYKIDARSTMSISSASWPTITQLRRGQVSLVWADPSFPES